MKEIVLSFPDYVLHCIQLLNDAGFQAYAVGGAVRSMLLGLPVHDYDLTTDALPQQTRTVFQAEKVYDTGIRHGTVTVVSQSHPIEITTFRRDSAYRDHRHPDQVQFAKTLAEDCRRRDFTINAICWHPAEGIIDYFGGRQDLSARLIRCIGDPDTRFQEDALRILRAIRFSAQLGFTIDGPTRDALGRNQDLLKVISAERIREEMAGILAAPGCADSIASYLPVFAVFFPELQRLREQPKQEAAVLAALPRTAGNAAAAMAILLQRICALNSPEADAILRRLKYSNQDRRLILQMLKYDSLPLSTRSDLRKMLHVLQPALASYLCFRQAADPSLDGNQICQTVQDIQHDNDCFQLRQLAISGREVRRLGWPDNKIATALNSCLTAVMEDRVVNRKKNLLDYLQQSRKE